MKYFNKLSLLTKVSLVVSLIIIVIEVMVAIPSVIKKKKDIFLRHHHFNFSLLHTIQKPLTYYLDSNQIVDSKMLMDMFRVHVEAEFKEYAITDRSGKLLVSLYKQTSFHTQKIDYDLTENENFYWKHLKKKNMLIYKYNITKENKLLYSVYLSYSDTYLWKQIWAYTEHVSLLIILIIVFTSAGIVFLLNPIIIRPIKRIVLANKKKEFIERRFFPGDELGSIMESRHEMLEQLRKHQSNLEDEIQEKTETLNQAYRKLQVLDKTKDDFLDLISHEMRTPLTLIENTFTLLKEQIVKGKKQSLHLLDIGIKNSKRLEKLADFSIDIAAMNEGKFMPKQESMNLNEIILSVILSMRPHAHQKEIVIKADSLEEEVLIMSDKARLVKVIKTVLENAIQFSPQNKKVIIEEEFRENNVIIKIQDFGTGIKEDVRHLVFEPFASIEDILSHTKGLGLSLFWCKKVMGILGGSISFESKEGQGTTFFIQLPLLQELKRRKAA